MNKEQERILSNQNLIFNKNYDELKTRTIVMSNDGRTREKMTISKTGKVFFHVEKIHELDMYQVLGRYAFEKIKKMEKG